MREYLLAVAAGLAIGGAWEVGGGTISAFFAAPAPAPSAAPAATAPAPDDGDKQVLHTDPTDYVYEQAINPPPKDPSLTVDYSFSLRCDMSDTSVGDKKFPPITIPDGNVLVAYNHGKPDPYSIAATFQTTVTEVTPNAIAVGSPWRNHGFFDRTNGHGEIVWGATWPEMKVGDDLIWYFHANKTFTFEGCKAVATKF
jgi:hypothetical protein